MGFRGFIFPSPPFPGASALPKVPTAAAQLLRNSHSGNSDPTFHPCLAGRNKRLPEPSSCRTSALKNQKQHLQPAERMWNLGLAFSWARLAGTAWSSWPPKGQEVYLQVRTSSPVFPLPMHKLKTELFAVSTQQKKTFVGLLNNIFSQQEGIPSFLSHQNKTGNVVFHPCWWFKDHSRGKKQVAKYWQDYLFHPLQPRLLPLVSVLLLLLLESFQHSWQELGNGTADELHPRAIHHTGATIQRRNHTH